MVESDSDVGIRIVKEGRRWFKWEAQWGFVGVGAGEVVGWRSSTEGSPQFPTTLKCKSLAAVCEQQKRLVMGNGTLVGGTGTLQSIGTRAVHIRVPQSVVLYYLLCSLESWPLLLRDRDVAKAHTTYIPCLRGRSHGGRRLGGATSDFHQPPLVTFSENFIL